MTFPGPPRGGERSLGPICFVFFSTCTFRIHNHLTNFIYFLTCQTIVKLKRTKHGSHRTRCTNQTSSHSTPQEVHVHRGREDMLQGQRLPVLPPLIQQQRQEPQPSYHGCPPQAMAAPQHNAEEDFIEEMMSSVNLTQRDRLVPPETSLDQWNAAHVMAVRLRNCITQHGLATDHLDTWEPASEVDYILRDMRAYRLPPMLDDFMPDMTRTIVERYRASNLVLHE